MAQSCGHQFIKELGQNHKCYRTRKQQNINSTKHTSSSEEGLVHPRREAKGADRCTSQTFHTCNLTGVVSPKRRMLRFENLKLLMKEPQAWYSTKIQAALKNGFRHWWLALTATFKTILNVKCVCGHCKGMREVLEAQWQMTNCDSICPRTLKPFRYEITELFDAVYNLLLKLALVIEKWKVTNVGPVSELRLKKLGNDYHTHHPGKNSSMGVKSWMSLYRVSSP